MRLTHLSLTNFRNFSRLDQELPGGSILLVGGNAQGKTSLLEAIYLLATFTSFHAASERQLISFREAKKQLAVARVAAEFRYTFPQDTPAYIRPSVQKMEVRLVQEANELGGQPRFRKEILLEGVKKKAGEAIGVFNAVLFLPQMLRVVEGAPEERRRYLNLAIGQVTPHYAQNLADYYHVLTQRNSLLRQLNERSGDAGQLVYWDEYLARLGGQIIFDRIRAIRELERPAGLLHSELTRGQERLRLDYRPSFDPLPQKNGQLAMTFNDPVDRSGLTLEKIQEGFLDCLGRSRAEEIARGTTSSGPHRDELRFQCNQIDLGAFGSRGQNRTAMMAMKLAEVTWMKEKTGQWPVLLLDEVLAELDPDRRVDLLARLQTSEQALLTTTDLDLFSHGFLQNASLWRVEGGVVSEEAAS